MDVHAIGMEEPEDADGDAEQARRIEEADRIGVLAHGADEGLRLLDIVEPEIDQHRVDRQRVAQALRRDHQRRCAATVAPTPPSTTKRITRPIPLANAAANSNRPPPIAARLYS